MSKAAWEQSGYSELEAAELRDGEIVVTFVNGDAVAVPPALLGELAPEQLQPSIDEEDRLGLLLSRDGDPVRAIGWSQIRAATDPLFAQHMRELDAEESRRLGRRLKALREDQGIKQSDLAALVKMPAPQLSKIEKGSHDMRVSTVRTLLRALDASFADISGPDVPEISRKRLIGRMKEAGVTPTVAASLLESLPRRSIHALLEQVLGWSREAIEAGTIETAPLAGAVQFKTTKRDAPHQTPLLHLAQAVAAAGRLAAPGGYTPIRAEPAMVRSAVEQAMGELTLRSLLIWTWRQGIPVLPMTGRGTFSAAVFNVDGPVIVIKESRDVPAFWLFDLAHELGHIARGHVESRSIIDIDEPTSGDALGSRDTQEQEANAFALNLLAPNYESLVTEVRKRSVGHYLAFKDAVASTARDHRVNPGVLGVIAAHELTDIGQHKDRWGSSINLSKEDGEGRAVAIEVARRTLQPQAVDEDGWRLLEAVVLDS